MQVQIFRGRHIPLILQDIREKLGDEVVILSTETLRDGTFEIKVSSEELHNGTTSADIRPDSLDSILRAQGLSDPFCENVTKRGLESVLEQNLRFDSSLLSGTRIISFVGATGAGKTTTIAKLAARLKKECRMKVGLIAADSFRVGAGFQLHSYASVLGVPCLGLDPKCDPASQLAKQIRRLRQADIIFVDTPGCSPGNRSQIEKVQHCLSGAEEPIEKIFTIPAVLSAEALRVSFDSFASLGCSRLLFTKIDESFYLGPAVQFAEKHKLPISFFTTGQSVPEDIEPASVARLAWMLRRRIH